MTGDELPVQPLTDPVTLPGDVAGPGGPHDERSMIADASRAVLLDTTEVLIVHPTRGGRPAPDCVGMLLSGRVNGSAQRAQVLFLLDAAGAAAVTTELEALMRRAGPAWLDEYGSAKYARRARLREEGVG